VREHVQKEQELAVADPRKPRAEGTCHAALVLGARTASSSRFQSLP